MPVAKSGGFPFKNSLPPSRFVIFLTPTYIQQTERKKKQNKWSVYYIIVTMYRDLSAWPIRFFFNRIPSRTRRRTCYYLFRPISFIFFQLRVINIPLRSDCKYGLQMIFHSWVVRAAAREKKYDNRPYNTVAAFAPAN